MLFRKATTIVKQAMQRNDFLTYKLAAKIFLKPKYKTAVLMSELQQTFLAEGKSGVFYFFLSHTRVQTFADFFFFPFPSFCRAEGMSHHVNCFSACFAQRHTPFTVLLLTAVLDLFLSLKNLCIKCFSTCVLVLFSNVFGVGCRSYCRMFGTY